MTVMALALAPTRGASVYRKLDTVENCSWIGNNCIQTALVLSLHPNRQLQLKSQYDRVCQCAAAAGAAPHLLPRCQCTELHMGHEWLACMVHAGTVTDHAGDPQTRARPEFAQNASKHDLAAIGLGEVLIQVGGSYTGF